MSRLRPHIFSEIAISLIPLAKAPTWVKALWVEKELEARGLWRDDVFELVRPFLVSSKNTGQNKDQPEIKKPNSAPNSLIQPVQPRPEVTVSKPLLSEVEAKWSPSFVNENETSDEIAALEPEAASAQTVAEYFEPDDISVPELWQSKLKSEDLTPEQAELASVMHLIAVSASLDDDSKLELPEEWSQLAAPGATGLASDEDESVDSGLPIEHGGVEQVEPDVPVSTSAVEQIETEIPVELTWNEPVETETPAETEEVPLDVELLTEARNTEPEKFDHAEASNVLKHEAEPDTSPEIEQGFEEESIGVPVERGPVVDVFLWSETRLSEEEIQSQFEPAEEPVIEESFEVPAESEESPEPLAEILETNVAESIEVILWSEKRRPEYEIASEFNVPVQEASHDELTPPIIDQPDPATESDVAATETLSEPGVVLWSEARNVEEEVQKQFAQPVLRGDEVNTPGAEEAAVTALPEAIVQPAVAPIVPQVDVTTADSSTPRVDLASVQSPKRASKPKKNTARRRSTSRKSKQKDITVAKSNKSKPSAAGNEPGHASEPSIAPAIEMQPVASVVKLPAATVKNANTAQAKKDKPQKTVELKNPAKTGKMAKPRQVPGKLEVAKPEALPAPKQPSVSSRVVKQVKRVPGSVESTRASDNKSRLAKTEIHAAKPIASPAKKTATEKVAEVVGSVDAPGATVKKPTSKPVQVSARPNSAKAATSDSRKIVALPVQKATDTAKPSAKRLKRGAKTVPVISSANAGAEANKPVASKPVQKSAQPVNATAATGDSKKVARKSAKISSAAAKPGKKTSQPKKVVTTQAASDLAEHVARIKQEKREKAAKASKQLRNQATQKTVDSVRQKLKSPKIEQSKEPLKDLEDAADAAGIADFYGLHIDGATNADRAKLLFFASVLKSQQGDWDGSDEQLQTALDALGDSMQARIWRRVIEQSMRIHDQVDRSAA